MRRLLLVLALLVTASTRAAAQSNTAEALQRAIRFLEDVEIERALVILRQIISPNSPFEVSREQREAAYKYIGAAFAMQSGPAKRDSAILFFRAAIERDPFVDLDPASFTPAQLAVFGEARARTFGIAIRPVRADTFAPGSGALDVRVFTTHRAHVRIEIRAGDGAVRTVLFEGENDGLRELRWNGQMDGGRLPPPGRAEIAVIAQSQLLQLTDSTRMALQLAHLHEPLEDSIPPLGPGDLLPEQYARSVATGDLFRGLGAAAAAVLARQALMSSSLGGARTGEATVVASAGAVLGLATYLWRQNHRDIPANIAENRRRQSDRAERNAAVAMRNDARLAATRLVVTPLAGGER